ncbi:scarecrow-like protein 14 [Salvia divinorum]|uniref:Scarecrow-like protein 14 n=1 Tax=Salvia divinorum TaxID=28513 RepID=A0ABD1HQE6_SALDI
MGTISRCDSRNEFRSSYAAECGGGQAAAHHGGGEGSVPGDYFGGVFDYIKQMLLEEDDLDHRPCMFQDCSALQAAEKYFHDALSDRASAPPLDFAGSANFPLCSDNAADPSTISCDLDWLTESRAVVVDSNPPDHDSRQFQEATRNPPDHDAAAAAGARKTRGRGDNNDEERSSKQSAGYAEESVRLDKYDKSLLCPKLNPHFYDDSPPCLDDETSDDSEEESKKQYRKTKEVKRGRPKGSKKNRKVSQVVDLRTLLTRCAEAVSTYNTAAAQNLLSQIRNHSSPYGDPNERLAHCFANALEARMTGTGAALYTSSATKSIPAAQLLKSYQSYVTACPFKRMSNIFANKSIAKISREATKLHIIDFGILYGFQWPCIIHGLSLKPGGPPRLKITGIDYPQPGFKPGERVEQTGRRLVECCKRFNVPFEYKAIAKKWDEVCLEELEIERDEMVVANCLYRLRHTADESAGVESQRDAVLNLIKRINPELFVHGVANGSYSASFFTTRFKEAVFHYSSVFDMMEATLPREDPDRLMYEREVYGRDVMNVIACEGAERVERPDTYKQWQIRNQRAGFGVVALNREIVEEVRAKVRWGYHSDFLLEEDGGWLLQGWKGRVMYALSCWKPFPNPKSI